MFRYILVLGIVFNSFQAVSLAQTYNFDFSEGYEGWEGGFADYRISDSLLYELEFERTTLPSPLDNREYALMISGMNRSDDLFMFIKKKITGLEPNTEYYLSIDVELASNAPTNAIGVGGSPGEGVALKAGGSAIEPEKIISGDFYVMNIDKGNQGTPGSDIDTIGHIGVSDTTTVYTLINRNNFNNLKLIRTNSNGEFWLCIGTDSGFEGKTRLYYNKISVTFDIVSRLTDKLQYSPKSFCFPNPANSILNVIPENAQVKIYKTDGQQLLDIALENGKINISGLKSGVYVISINSITQLLIIN
jgi:hypothetical protein